MPRRFETLRIGIAKTAGFECEVRVTREAEASSYWLVYAMNAHGPFRSLEEAVASCERTFEALSWRASLDADESEVPCPICAAPVQASRRYPRALCPPCVLEAVDQHGQSLRFYNTSPGGGFEARRPDGATSDEHGCFVRGIACRAAEAYFGGIVVQRI